MWTSDRVNLAQRSVVVFAEVFLVLGIWELQVTNVFRGCFLIFLDVFLLVFSGCSWNGKRFVSVL